MNIGTVHIHTGEFLPYLALAYALFFLVIFAFVVSMSRRQDRVSNDLLALRRALEEATHTAEPRTRRG